MSDRIHCEIRVKGHLSNQWVDWFSGLEIENQPDGEAVLAGYLPDQAALYGILKHMGNLGLALISLSCVEHSLDRELAQKVAIARKLRALTKGPTEGTRCLIVYGKEMVPTCQRSTREMPVRTSST